MSFSNRSARVSASANHSKNPVGNALMNLVRNCKTSDRPAALNSPVSSNPMSLSACAAALDLTFALGPFDTSPEIMCERGASERASEARASDSAHLENEFEMSIGMRGEEDNFC